ncbi:nuclease-related domain-containing protein [Brachybacterium paraconglomeratum]|uniref:nuclease-related domain-containing protein n=1 Tax=Brachybacterium paraconglomeratum TaxID=173362 RepID=UPI0022B04F62|nr:nuclease-related domain-containing protein [Brachybacterium paraconglomeratum]MCZ4326725.1 nuclease-related domain-containing protein [Brachybacterium paraconglomeratum]
MGTTRISPPGQVLGVAGSGLVNADWAASKNIAKMGRRGEVSTATVLNSAARSAGGPTVLHHVQPDGAVADVDHILVAGRSVYLLDSKVWKPALYWTRGGRHRRSVSLLAHEPAAHLPTPEDLARSRARVSRVLEAASIDDADVIGPVIVVWPSSEKRLISTSLLHLGDGVTVVPGRSLERAVHRMSRQGSADQRIVRALAEQLQAGDGKSGGRTWR